MSRLSLEEQETIINIERLGDVAHVYTCDSRYITKLDKLVEASDEWKCVGENEIGKEYECPVGFISFRSKTTKREMTEEQREAARERMKELQERKRRNAVLS